jgi:hemoglobin
LFDEAGGEEAVHGFIDVFYCRVLADPIVHRLFGAGRPEQVTSLTAFEAESFGGPGTFTGELGLQHLIEVRGALKIAEEQRARFVEFCRAAADKTRLPGDTLCRGALRSQVGFGYGVAMRNSNAEIGDEAHPLRHVLGSEWPG